MHPAELGVLGGELDRITAVEGFGSSSSAWLMRDAFARMPRIRSIQGSDVSTDAKCVG